MGVGVLEGGGSLKVRESYLSNLSLLLFLELVKKFVMGGWVVVFVETNFSVHISDLGVVLKKKS